MRKLFLLLFCTGSIFPLAAQQIPINGTSGSGQFGYSLSLLTNGNYVVTDPYYDEGATQDVGAVYLYDGATHSIISILKGSTTNDKIGYDGVTALPNGNFVVRSLFWDNGTATDAGAVTWCSGTSGLSGVVNSANSLVGTTANDKVGSNGVTVLSNGNYVVGSGQWDNGALPNAGAVTWCSGVSGLSDAVSSTNSLVGSTPGDGVGFKVISLSNGNYVVNSMNWSNGVVKNVGAVTWCNGTSGLSGVVSVSNSLVGTTSGDYVGGIITEFRLTSVQFNGVTALSNGNYIVSSPHWDNGVATDAGAVTLCSGTSSYSGEVNVSNSLVGSTSNDHVGLAGFIYISGGMPVSVYGVTALSNGNYVVSSSEWDNGATTDAGAVTWCSGNLGQVGSISISNSLVGITSLDKVGSGGVTALSNGNFVVSSPIWNNGASTDVGAVTWGNGDLGITGAVSGSNSLIGGTSNDNVSSLGVTPLTNGNFVVNSPNWNNGVSAHAGAVTWGNGELGLIGLVSSGNSLVGTNPSDGVGNVFTMEGSSRNGVTALSNGNYVVSSPGWQNRVGAVTWCNGSTGLSGTVNTSNSLTGGFAGSSGVTALLNGNYVVSNINWRNGQVDYAGSVTWGNGTLGNADEVNINNSLVGSSSNDMVGGSTYLSNSGNVLYSANGVTPLSNGDYVVKSPYWHNGNVVSNGAITWGNGSGGVTGTLNSCNSVIGGSNYIFNGDRGYMVVGSPATNSIVIFNPINVSLANNLDDAIITISGQAAVSLILNPSCRIITTIMPNGANPVDGNVNAKAWVESTIPTYGGQPFVARHYEITPAVNAATATGRVTLYFTQQEFDAFNADAGSLLDLPNGPEDDAGKANLRIGKYSGTSIDGSGLPQSYSGAGMVIDPNDEDIVWNSHLNRWEVSFDVTGFSGFIVQTSSELLPLTLLEFNGRLQDDDALLQWKTTNEENAGKFIVDRSTDARTFTSIGEVNARNQPGTNFYEYTDAGVTASGAPTVYYRLKQTDKDNRFSYSQIIALPVSKQGSFLLYPNSAQNILLLSIAEEKPERLLVRIQDNAGRTFRNKQWNMISGNGTLQIDVSELAKGMYYLELKGKTIEQRIVFVKQ